MVLKKQTIWLLTMLTLMVVLSAYYLYNPPMDDEYLSEESAEQMDGDAADKNGSEETSSEDVNLTDLEDSDWLGLDIIGDLDTDFSMTEADETSTDTIADEGFTETIADDSSMEAILSLRLEKEAQRAEQLEHYDELMGSSESTAQTIAEAKSEYDALQDLTLAEETLEELIEEKGYAEAVVIADKERVNVLVSAPESLGRAEAVEIIHLVREHLDIPGNQVYVSYQ